MSIWALTFLIVFEILGKINLVIITFFSCIDIIVKENGSSIIGNKIPVNNIEVKVSNIFAFTESKAAFLKSIMYVDYKNLALL